MMALRRRRNPRQVDQGLSLPFFPLRSSVQVKINENVDASAMCRTQLNLAKCEYSLMALMLCEIPFELRPRERLESSGASTLSDIELLAMLIGSGIKGRDVLHVASDVLKEIDNTWPRLSTATLRKIPGVGAAKATLIVAALEFARRRIRPFGTKIAKAKDAIPLLAHYANRKQEHFICITLNGAHEVIATRVVTIGLANSAPVHPREVFCDAINDRACAVVLAHNHPSGSTNPSEQDCAATRTLKNAGELLGIRVLDHIIFSQDGYFSFAESGTLG